MTEQRQPPSNSEAEMALLGAILVNNQAYHAVSEFLLPEHFALPVHGRIYGAVRLLVDRGENANPVSLQNLFDNDADMLDGGGRYLVRLAANVVTIGNAKDYGRTILDCFQRRALIEAAERAIEQAYKFDESGTTARDIARRAEQEIGEVDASAPGDTGPLLMSNIVPPYLQQVEDAWRAGGRLLGLSTGFHDLDRILGGLQPEFIVLAARPGMAKSTTAGVIADNIVRAKAGAVAIFSLEQRKELWAARWISRRTNIPADAQMRGDVDELEWPRFVGAAVDVGALPIIIDDSPRLAVATIRARARRLVKEHGVKLIIIDHIGQIPASEDAVRHGETAKMTEVSRELRGLPKELGVPVLAICQLSRAVESRDNKRPQLSDLRQSGAIEEDAHAVMFLYRRSYYLERDEPERGTGETDGKWDARLADHRNALEDCLNVAELIVAKNRGGGLGTAMLYYDGARAELRDLAKR